MHEQHPADMHFWKRDFSKLASGEKYLFVLRIPAVCVRPLVVAAEFLRERLIVLDNGTVFEAVAWQPIPTVPDWIWKEQK